MYIKRFIILMVSTTLLFNLTSCENKAFKSNKEGSENSFASQSTSVKDDGNTKKNTVTTPTGNTTNANTQANSDISKHEPSGTDINNNTLEANDFIVTDGMNSIKLDIPFKDFTVNLEELKTGNNYVGEVYSGSYIYKVYVHRYNDFDIYVSNINYNVKNRKFDDRYITQITLKNASFKTHKGIAIGDKLDKIITLYGEGKNDNMENNNIISYRLNDMKLNFTIDQKNTVVGITLNIVT